MPSRPPNLPMPTLGGKQLWNDQLVTAGGWRIQQHVATKHHRLLDDADGRRAWGEFDACRAQLPKQDERLDRETVVCVHGLMRSRDSMEPMAAHLRGAGYRVLNIGYASTRGTVDDHARTVETVLYHGPQLKSTHWVGHSLGNLIARRYEKRRHEDGLHQDHTMPRLGRVVMLAPPNQGSKLATRLKDNPLFHVIDGPAGQLIAEWKHLAATLATPTDVGVVAGRYDGFTNPLLRETGDLVVSLEETKLPGMRDFAVVPHSHSFIMARSDVMKLTATYLKTGRFPQTP
ncbi:MAG: alpha/beta fold hydrolase [Planctomycetota bacterium]